MPAALADQLTAARRRSFVGRQAELTLFQSLLGGSGSTGDTGPSPGGTGLSPGVAGPIGGGAGGSGGVVYVRGPGGVGKTTLLRQVAWL
ncbi:MAG TPA: hypothetical protein VJT31_02380, partial [Rugosimonospora sp.]|nr:hypothetical protein [Rugosimonospora sp.]